MNHQLMEEEFTGGMVIPPGITGSRVRNPPEEWLSRQESPAHEGGIHRRNGYPARNYRLMDKESTGGIVIPPGIISWWKRKTTEEWLSHQESPVHGLGILWRNGFPSGNHQLMDEKSIRGMVILQRITRSRTVIYKESWGFIR
jgi:hypothetical protein